MERFFLSKKTKSLFARSGASNSIFAFMQLTVDIRFQTNEVMDELRRKFYGVADNIAAALQKIG